FAPAIHQLNLVAPWPQLWAQPDLEAARLGVAMRGRRLPTTVHAQFLRRAVLLSTLRDDLGNPREITQAVAYGAISLGEEQYLLAVLFGRASNGKAALEAYRRAAADRGTGEHGSWIKRDVELVGGAEVAATWEQLPFAERAAWITDFWESRDLADGLELGTRLAIHFERWREAMKRYQLIFPENRLRQPNRRHEIEDVCLSTRMESGAGGAEAAGEVIEMKYCRMN